MKISISGLKLFKACRRAYELKYIEGLTPVSQAPALATGSSYHETLEELYKTGDVDVSDLSKESAMALAYKKYVYPVFEVQQVEQWFEAPILGEHKLIGRVDGIAKDGSIVEHKTTSAEITEEYEFNLQWDEQILAYMWATGSRKVWYTVCQKPTIRLKKDESEQDFFDRMVDWYDESKIKVLEIERTDEEIDAFEKDLRKMVEELQTDNYYRNTMNCTCWGRRCEYSPVCLHYDPEQEYVGFNRRDKDADSKA